MKAHEFNKALDVLGWRKVDAASRLDISKPYVSLIAAADVPVPGWIAEALDAAVDAVLAAREASHA